RPDAPQERVRARATVFAAGGEDVAAARGAEGHRRRLYHAAPRAPLPRLRRDAVAVVPEGVAATGEAAVIRLPCVAHRHSPHAHGRGRGQPAEAERAVPLAVRGGTGREKARGAGAVDARRVGLLIPRGGVCPAPGGAGAG